MKSYKDSLECDIHESFYTYVKAYGRSNAKQLLEALTLAADVYQRALEAEAKRRDLNREVC